jgi:hypothetical protein
VDRRRRSRSLSPRALAAPGRCCGLTETPSRAEMAFRHSQFGRRALSRASAEGAKIVRNTTSKALRSQAKPHSATPLWPQHSNPKCPFTELYRRQSGPASEALRWPDHTDPLCTFSELFRTTRRHPPNQRRSSVRTLRELLTESPVVSKKRRRRSLRLTVGDLLGPDAFPLTTTGASSEATTPSADGAAALHVRGSASGPRAARKAAESSGGSYESPLPALRTQTDHSRERAQEEDAESPAHVRGTVLKQARS